ncbi:hypothetical protein [Marilutibacter alkalisoli]|uniref:hypothetical protein n=1 Tax=Marilutibacter alkalisoli TaxID=2591633 RepID=UPI0014244E11|nr:hypothetical protein [Lysobacter alkalisoli]
MTRTAVSTRPAWRKALHRTLLVLAAAWLAYLLLGNLFLNTPVGPWAINRKPERVQVQWQSALTVWPGQVMAWNLDVGGHTGTTLWKIRGDRAHGRLALLALFRKELRFASVRAEGIEIDIDRGAEPMAPSPARQGGWVVRFDRITSGSVRAGRLQELTLEGTGHAEFGFSKQMHGGPMEITTSTARFDGARVTQAGDTLLELDTLSARFAMDSHTREQASGIHKLLVTVAELDFDGRTTALRLEEAGDERIRLHPAADGAMGHARGRIGWQRGELAAGSQLDWTSPLPGSDSKNDDSLVFGLEVDHDIHLRASLPDHLTSNGDTLALDADLVLAGNAIPLDDPRTLLPRSSGHLVGRWQFDSLKWIGRYFADAPWLVLDGAGRIDADVRLVDGEPVAGSRIEVPGIDVVADVMGNRMQGRARAEGVLQPAGEGDKGGIRPRLDLRLERFAIIADAGRGARYVEGRDLRLEIEAVHGLDRSLLEQDDGAVRAGEALRARLRFSDADVPDLRVYNRYLPRSQLRFEGGRGLLSGDLSLDGAGAIGRGWLRVRGRDTRLHAAGMALRGNIDVNTRLRRADLEDGRFNIDGSQIRLDNISLVEPDGRTRRGWWARVDLDRARLDWRLPGEARAKKGSAQKDKDGATEVDINGHARIAMKDVGFLLALYSQRADYPKWVPRLVDAGEARVTGDVQWRDDILILDNLVADNDRFDVRARLRLQGRQRRGNLYARWGVLGMAVDLDDTRSELHLVRARQWYDAQPSLLR